MAKKTKEQEVSVNNLRSENFANFEATHEFTAESPKAAFTRAAILAGLTNNEIVEVGDAIYGEGGMKLTCISWYRHQDPILNPGKERYKATGAKSLEVRAKVTDYYNDLNDEDKNTFASTLVSAIGIEELIKTAKVEVLKSVVPEDLFPVAVKKDKKAMTDIEKLMKKQKLAEEKAAKLQAELNALQGMTPGEAATSVEDTL